MQIPARSLGQFPANAGLHRGHDLVHRQQRGLPAFALAQFDQAFLLEGPAHGEPERNAQQVGILELRARPLVTVVKEQVP